MNVIINWSNKLFCSGEVGFGVGAYLKPGEARVEARPRPNKAGVGAYLKLIKARTRACLGPSRKASGGVVPISEPNSLLVVAVEL